MGRGGVGAVLGAREEEKRERRKGQERGTGEEKEPRRQRALRNQEQEIFQIT